VEIIERTACMFRRRRLALDAELVALGADFDAELLFQPCEVLVELPVEGTREFVVVEGQDDVRHVRCPGGQCFQVGGGAQITSLLGRPQAGTAKWLLGPALVIRTLIMSPIWAAFSSTIKGCNQGERPKIWPGLRPGFSIRASISRPTREAVKACCCSISRACSRWSRSSLTISST